MKYLTLKHLPASTLFTGIFGLWLLLSMQEGQAQELIKLEPAAATALEKDPVNNFVSFNPAYIDGKTYLRWLVKDDKKDGVFIIERSENGDAFEALGFKDRIGTNAEVNLFYSWIDDSPPAYQAYYRIMQVGLDQTYNYSQVVRVKTGPTSGSSGAALHSDK